MLPDQIVPKPMDPLRASMPMVGLADPHPALVAGFLSARIAHDKAPGIPEPLPEGVRVNLRPHLPKAMPRAVSLYMSRRSVDSFPLLFATMAFANPN